MSTATISVSIPATKDLNTDVQSVLVVSLCGSSEVTSDPILPSESPEYNFSHDFTLPLNHSLLNNLVGPSLSIRVLGLPEQQQSKAKKPKDPSSSLERLLFQSSICLSPLLSGDAVSSWFSLKSDSFSSASVYVEASVTSPALLDENNKDWKSLEISVDQVLPLPSRMIEDQKLGQFLYVLSSSLPFSSSEDSVISLPLTFSRLSDNSLFLSSPSPQYYYLRNDVAEQLISSALRNDTWQFEINRELSVGNDGSGFGVLSPLYNGVADVAVKNLIEPGQKSFNFQSKLRIKNQIDPTLLIPKDQKKGSKLSLTPDEMSGDPFSENQSILKISIKFSDPLVPERKSLPPPPKHVSTLLPERNLISDSEFEKKLASSNFKSVINRLVAIVMDQVMRVEEGQKLSQIELDSLDDDDENYQELRRKILYNINSSGQFVSLLDDLMTSSTDLAVKNHVDFDPLGVNLFELLLSQATEEMANIFSQNIIPAKISNLSFSSSLSDFVSRSNSLRNVVFDLIYQKRLNEAVDVALRMTGTMEKDSTILSSELSCFWLLLGYSQCLAGQTNYAEESLRKSLEYDQNCRASLALLGSICLAHNDSISAETALLYLNECESSGISESLNSFDFLNFDPLLRPALPTALLAVLYDLNGKTLLFAQMSCEYARFFPEEGHVIATLNLIEKDVTVSSTPHLLASKFFLYSGLYDLAESTLNNELKLKGATALSHALLAESFYKRNIISRAHESISDSFIINSNHAIAYHLRGLLNLKGQKYEEVLIDWKSALELSSSFPIPELYYDLAGLFLSDCPYKSPSDAAHLLTQAIQLFPQLPSCWRLLAQSYFLIGDYSQSEMAIKEAITLYPDCADSWAIFALICLVLNKRQDEALELAQQSIRLGLNNYNLLLDLGKSFLALNNYEFSLKLLKRAHGIKSNFLSFLLVGDAYYGIGEYEKALECYNSVVSDGSSGKTRKMNDDAVLKINEITELIGGLK
ncbi:hypothetical protein RCL1_000949 [Eukaryota sp. TZLM3-RCL]